MPRRASPEMEAAVEALLDLLKRGEFYRGVIRVEAEKRGLNWMSVGSLYQNRRRALYGLTGRRFKRTEVQIRADLESMLRAQYLEQQKRWGFRDGNEQT